MKAEEILLLVTKTWTQVKKKCKIGFGTTNCGSGTNQQKIKPYFRPTATTQRKILKSILLKPRVTAKNILLKTFCHFSNLASTQFQRFTQLQTELIAQHFFCQDENIMFRKDSSFFSGLWQNTKTHVLRDFEPFLEMSVK